MLRAFLLVGLGGALGSMARYGCFLAFPIRNGGSFPLVTLLVNLFGCLLIGLLIGLSQRLHFGRDELMLLLATGFCGGFTTFSAFALDNIGLMGRQQPLVSMLYIALSVLLGIALCRTGIWLAR